MAHPSWGSGWPNCQTGRLTTFTAGGRRWRLRAEVAPIFAHFLDEIVARGYVISDGQLDDWSFACRPIAGTRIASNHSWGLAVDINSLTNPMTFNGRLVTNVPAWVVACAAGHGLRWGGNYTGAKKDPMHFEWVGPLGESLTLAATLAAADVAAHLDPKDAFMPALSHDEQRELLDRVRRIEGSVAGVDDPTRASSIWWRVQYIHNELLDGDNKLRLRRILTKFGAG